MNLIGYAWEILIGGPGMLPPTGGGNIDRVMSAWRALSRQPCCRSASGGASSRGAFLHGGLIHIGVNMISLWSLGASSKWSLGPTRCCVIYMVSLVASGLGVVYLSAPLVDPTVGASGAIFGLFGALFAIGLKLGKPGMELVKANIGILVLNLIITFTVPSISWQAHVAGLAAGFLLTLLIYYPPRRVAPVVVDAQTGAELETEYQTPNPPRPSA